MEFILALLGRVADQEPDTPLAQAVEESYQLTLKPWHGWISSAAYRVYISPKRFVFYISCFQLYIYILHV